MLFAGIRPAEVERLEWADIDMEGRTVRVSNVKSKTDLTRFIDMEDTLHAWHLPIPQQWAA